MEGGATAIASYRPSILAMLYELCIAPSLRTTHYSLRTVFPGHWLLTRKGSEGTEGSEVAEVLRMCLYPLSQLARTFEPSNP